MTSGEMYKALHKINMKQNDLVCRNPIAYTDHINLSSKSSHYQSIEG
jgi:hypothetical protein